VSRGGDTRFAKGQSGNPNGRPKKRQIDEDSAFAIIIDQVVTVRDGNTTRTLSAEEALQLRTYQDALKGSRIAQRTIMRMIAKREAWRARHAPLPRAIQVKYEQPDRRRSADQTMLVLGISACEGPDDLETAMLEPWAVEAALQRLRSRKLTRLEVANIRISTRDGTSLRLDRYRYDTKS